MWNCNLKPNFLLPSFKKLLVYGTCYAFDYFIPEFSLSCFAPDTIDVQKVLLNIKKKKLNFKFNRTFAELSNFEKLYSMHNVLSHAIADETEPPEICAWNEGSLSGIIEFLEMAIQEEIKDGYCLYDKSEFHDSHNMSNVYARRLTLDAYRKMFIYMNNDALEEMEIKGVKIKTPFYQDPCSHEDFGVWKILLDDFRHYLICGMTYDQIYDNNNIDGYFKAIELHFTEKDFVNVVFDMKKMQKAYEIQSFIF